LFAVALAVGLTPELLPMVMTVTLARGAIRMAKKQVVVKRLAAIHDLGAMDVLCTDKTGTLTEARVALVAHPDLSGSPSAAVLALARLNARLTSGTRSALDAALLSGAPDEPPAARALASLPFDFDRRMVSVLVELPDGTRQLVVKGAAEAVLARCTARAGTDGASALADAERARLAAWEAAQAADGLRVLAVAFRAMPKDAAAVAAEDETGLTLSGHVVFADPPKASAAAAIARLQDLGVRTKILSGDAAPAVRHLVAVLGIPARGLLTGQEIAELSATALADQVGEVDLYARLSPDQKRRVIRALQARGHVVGFIGDGINDAPSIHAADAGLSVDGATDVARAAADMILLTPDLGVLADGVAEGRRTYANIMKYVRMGTSSNFGNMLSMAVASLVIPFLPLTAVQVLLNNFLYDLSELGIPFDRVAAPDAAAPRSWDMAEVRRFTMTLGPISSAFDMVTFAVLLLGFGAGVETFRTAWFVESMVTQILVIFLIRTTAPFWRDWPHPALAATSLAALAAALYIALGPFGEVFGFVPLGPGLLAALGVIVVAYLVVVELSKPYAMGRPARPTAT
ncbi:MAG: HAD-IC family P-type ATPase, partial [Acetobacteraceae bacterium]|nr:HAD-IC family P-type ATPase [Acetobacteraceae bacterium]